METEADDLLAFVNESAIIQCQIKKTTDLDLQEIIENLITKAKEQQIHEVHI